MSNESATPGAQSPIERRLATILCADVAGYSQMMGANEERTVRVFRGHREIFESLVGVHRGRIFNTAGDALLAEFQSAVEAVRCATEIQAALRTRNEHLAPEERMQFRIGINLGDVIIQGGDLLGDGVNVAARIQAATEPGGICISGSVHDQIQNKLSLDFKLLGEQSYKNIAKPVRTYTIAEGAAVTAPARRPVSKLWAVATVAAVAVGGAGFWGYQQFESRRAEQLRLEAQLAAQMQAAEQAQRTAEEAKREAQLQAQKLAAEETLRRAQEERSRIEQDRRKLEAERQAAAKPAPAVLAGRDGSYSGRLCNDFRGNAPKCWPVILVVRNGAIEASWLSAAKKTSSARGTIAADGAVQLQLNGWTPSGKANQAKLLGRMADGAIRASGKWMTGGEVAGEWKFAPAAAAAPKRANAYDGNYAGQLCARVAGKAPACWPVSLAVRNSAIEGSWLSRTGSTSRAGGTIAANGTLRLKLSAWKRDGTAIDAELNGRVAGDAMSAAGRWRDNTEVSGTWKRSP